MELEGLKEQARALGIDLGQERHQAEIASRAARARAGVVTQVDQAGGRTAGLYAAVESAITAIGDTLVLVLMLLLSNVALPVGIVGLAFVEIARVGDGIALFDPHNAPLMAIVAVSVYMLLLVIKSHLQMIESGNLDKERFSLRIAGRRLLYVLGIGRAWTASRIPAIERLESAIGAVGWVIIILGTLGSMRGMLAGAPGAWHVALLAIATDSTLTEFVSYIGGFVFTAALLAATHWAVGYAYERYSRLRPETSISTIAADSAAAIAEADYIKLLISREASKQAAKAARPTAAVRSGSPAQEPDGDGDTEPMPIASAPIASGAPLRNKAL